MTDRRMPDPTLMARLPLSVKGIEWAASLLKDKAYDRDGERWSAHQHLFHLVANERVFLTRLRKTLEEERPKFLRWDSEGFIRENYRREPGIDDLAGQLIDERAAGIDLLKGIGEKDWGRQAIWPDGRTVDIAWIAEKMLWHSLDHFATLLDMHGDLEPLQAGSEEAARGR